MSSPSKRAATGLTLATPAEPRGTRLMHRMRSACSSAAVHPQAEPPPGPASGAVRCARTAPRTPRDPARHDARRLNPHTPLGIRRNSAYDAQPSQRCNVRAKFAWQRHGPHTRDCNRDHPRAAHHCFFHLPPGISLKCMMQELHVRWVANRNAHSAPNNFCSNACFKLRPASCLGHGTSWRLLRWCMSVSSSCCKL